MREPDGNWLTTDQAAALAGVSVSTLKRWADQGIVECNKTAGQHRRFSRQALAAIASGPANVDSGPCAQWLADLERGNSHAIDAALLGMRAQRGSWAETADAFAPVLEAIGVAWQIGRLSVLEEHILSERIARAWSRAAASVPVAEGAPRVLLATACGDAHTLGLSLAEAVLREAGLQAVWSGRSTPVADTAAQLQAGRFALVALSASAVSDDSAALGAELDQLRQACAESGAAIVVGGAGAWPADVGPGVVRVFGFGELSGAVRALASAWRRRA